MVKVLQIQVFRVREGQSPVRLASVQDLASFSFFTRGTVSEHLMFGSRTVASKCALGSRMTVSLSDSPYRCHCHVRFDGLAATVTVDEDYPARVAFALITQTMKQFEQLSGDRWKLQDQDLENQPQFMKDDLVQYQDPRSVDKMAKIQDDLDEIKGIMNKNIADILDRGETLESLMEKSDDLSAQSVIFYKKAKKQNSCCR